MTLLSDLYGKQIITTTGNKLGLVEDVVLDFETGSIANRLLTKIENLTRAQNTAAELRKNSVAYERVRNVSETIIVSTSK